MRPIAVLIPALTLIAASIATPFGVVHAEPAIALVRVDVTLVASGYRATGLIGRSVRNDKHDKIGSIDDLMISKDGNAMFAILQVGSFLGLGGKLVAVPYKSLVIKDAGKTIILRGGSREALGALVEFKY
jgi:hypothetical protein